VSVKDVKQHRDSPLSFTPQGAEKLFNRVAKSSQRITLAASDRRKGAAVSCSTEGLLCHLSPADSMRGLKYVVTRGKTRVLSGVQLLGSIDTSKFIADDRAVIELRAYSSAPIGAGR